jgi:hypothetical protein
VWNSASEVEGGRTRAADIGPAGTSAHGRVAAQAALIDQAPDAIFARDAERRITLIEKPFSAPQLLEKLAQVLERRRGE